MNIHSIADLAKATPQDIEVAKNSLRIKDRIEAGLKRRGQQVGLTLAEYKAKLLEPQELGACKTCAGTGKIRAPTPRHVGVIHPSSAEKCTLRLYYDLTGEFAPKEYVSPEMQITFLIGHAIHEAVQDVLVEDLGAACQVEVSVELGEWARGNVDCFVQTEQTACVVELKTMGDEHAKLQKPKKEHITQAGGLYQTALDVPFAAYEYISKKWPHPIKEYVEVYDEEIFGTWFRKKGKPALLAARTGVPPVADGTPQECQECKYAWACTQKLSRQGNRFTRK